MYESAKQILELIEKSPVKNPSSSFSLSDGDSHDVAESDWISSRYVFLDERHGDVEKIVWNKIAAAMRQNKIIEFDYVREYDGESTRRKVKPYQVLKSRENWTLWGRDVKRNDFRLFTMARISDVKITEEKFSLPKDFEYEKHSECKDSVWYNAEESEFKIWLNDDAMEKTRNCVWGKNQKEAETKDGWEVSFSTSNFDLVMEKLISLAENAKPLEPEEFCEEYYEHLRAMAEMRKITTANFYECSM